MMFPDGFKKQLKLSDVQELGDVMIKQLSHLFEKIPLRKDITKDFLNKNFSILLIPLRLILFLNFCKLFLHFFFLKEFFQ